MKYAIWQYPVHFLAYGLGMGLIPFAPGTFGSLVGIVLLWCMAGLTPLVYAVIVVVMSISGIFICGQTARDTGAIDPGMIVFDEITGFLVAMYMLPVKWIWLLPGFAIYRFFDILKPWPIHASEQLFGLGTSIMADDIIAGLYTLAILHAIRLVLAKKEVAWK